MIANSGANLTVRPGTVHAVLGENGAGKTTLMNYLAGVYRPDEGAVRLGKQMSFSSPADAIAGVGMIHQEFRLVPTLPSPRTSSSAQPHGSSTRAVSRRRSPTWRLLRLHADPARPVCNSMGERQRVEILKALCVTPTS